MKKIFILSLICFLAFNSIAQQKVKISGKLLNCADRKLELVNKKVQIISIASSYAKNRRSRYDIIKKNGMNWLQLEDTNDSFAKSYQANFIPRFIIIDKQGNIVDSDAVRPSEPEKLMAILNKEINK